jgi:transcriptional regulator of arginine metabolism
MSKNYRQGQILKLVRSKEIYTQDELAQALKALGIVATQVTLSRDLRDLRLVKTQEGYQELAADETSPQLETLARDFLRDVRGAQNLLVLKTDPGYASPIAVALDNEDWDDIVGTIAGDDTVLLVTPDNTTAETVRRRLIAILDH